MNVREPSGPGRSDRAVPHPGGRIIAYEHVRYLWDENRAAAEPVEQLLYRSNLLGADLRITNYGGGNTSVKAQGRDAITGEKFNVLERRQMHGLEIGDLFGRRHAAQFR